MKAFHNNPAIKKKYVNRIIEHQKLDQLIKGSYWDGSGKGCAVGCTIHSSDHGAYEKELGIPKWLAKVEDRLFEGISIERSKKWPRQFLEAIKPGVDLEKVKIPFLIIVVESARKNLDHKKFPKCIARVDAVLKELKNKNLDKEKLLAAASLPRDDAAAYAAAAADAAAYAAAAAAAAAYAAAAAAAYADAADAAAYAAAAYAAYAAARSDQYEYFADELLKLLRSLK